MNRILYILLTALVMVLVAATWIAPAATSTVYQQDFAAIDRYIVSQMEAARIPGVSVAVVQGDQIVHLKGYGTADPSGRAVSGQTPFMIASTAKAITAIAIMQLVEKEQVNLDAPVQAYLPWFRVSDPDASARITVRHLLTHTSGISEADGNEVPPVTDLSDGALEKRVRRLSSAQLVRPVGEHYGYSSANYDTLGLIVQVVSKQPYEDYVHQHIFQPLEMSRTSTSHTEDQKNGAATGYRSWLGFPAAFQSPITRAYAPSGGTIASSAEDMAHLLIAVLNEGHYGRVSLGISPENIQAMLQPAVRSYSDTSFATLGWGASSMYGVQTVGAGGDASNFKARLLMVPDQKLGLVVLINMNSVNVNSGLFELQSHMLALLLGQPPAPSGPQHFMMSFGGTLFVLLISLLFAAGIVRSLVRLRQTPGRTSVFSRIILPLATAGLWAAALLVGLPQMTSRTLPFMLLYVPDFGYAILVSVFLAVLWSLVMAGTTVYTSLRTRHVAAAPAVT